MQKHILCLFYVMCLTLMTKAEEPENGQFKALPKKRWINTFTADSRAHRLSMAKNLDQKRGANFENLVQIQKSSGCKRNCSQCSLGTR